MSCSHIWTIGHWTQPIPAFLATLRRHDIDLVADVRAQAGSRRSPQFDSDTMAQWLADAGIGYLHLPTLGGRRPRQDVDPEINAGWQNPSFKNYADYTLSDEYASGIAELIDLASTHRVAIMCGEPMPWRCHRSLIANTLAAAGWTVHDLMPDGSSRDHELGAWGATPVVGADGRITYPA
ncbi:DUF488 domain-containing protein [Flexivirga sp. ID2601S]|uniref:DUF488 domain-containing protein n=1 Tax=Flexivirga aerilata TaxID=1656889 RepID=A0A849AN82_9MICO|nr:DUF488 domain-containing protein [Flexivirga aerilata]